MLHVTSLNLLDNSVTQLAKWQNLIDSKPTFTERTNEAQRLWNKHSTQTFKDVKSKLSLMCPGNRRCVYCEDSFADEIEHIYPKNLFPNKTFLWENYIYACGPCNVLKNNKFGLVQPNEQVLVITPDRGQPVQEPENLPSGFIDPRAENPAELLQLELFDTFFYIPNDNISNIEKNRADFTITTLGLNSRSNLVAARKSAYYCYLALSKAYVSLKNNPSSNQAILQAYFDILENQNWPFVWFEMKRSRSFLPEVDEILNQAPELI